MRQRLTWTPLERRTLNCKDMSSHPAKNWQFNSSRYQLYRSI